MAISERELTELFDNMNESELDELIGDIDIKADKQPKLKGLFNGKGHKAMKKNIKKKTAATIAALVAALGITATAGIGTNLYLCKIAMDIVAKHIPGCKCFR